MQKYYRKYIILILLAFMITPANAKKKGYSQGYIITNEGETIEGWVKDRSSGTFTDLYTRIRFKADNARIKRKYRATEILGYGLDNRHYESVPLVEESEFFRSRYYIHDDKDRIFLRIISGNIELTYYHWEYIDGESNYLDYTPLFHRNGSCEMVRVSQGILGLKRNRLMEYFRDCPELVLAIKNKGLNEVLEVYNFYLEKCSCRDSTKY